MKLVAFAMSMVMIFSIPIVASSSAQLSSIDHYVLDDGTALTTFTVDDITFTLRITELDNGDVILYEYQNDVLIRRGIMYIDQRDRVYITDFVTTQIGRNLVVEGVQSVEIFHGVTAETAELPNISAFSAITPFSAGTFLGTVGIQQVSSIFPGGPIGDVYNIAVRYTEGDTTLTEMRIMNWSGTALALASLVVAIAAIPVTMGGSVTAWIITVYGLVAGGIGVLTINHAEFDVNRTRINFNLTNNSSQRPNRPATGGFATYRYTITQRSGNRQNQAFWPTLGLQFSNNSVSNVWGMNAIAQRANDILLGFWLWEVHRWS